MDPTADACDHLDAARRHCQRSARRHRQVLEIAGLIVSGRRERAEGLALLHLAEFPSDAELLARMAGQQHTHEAQRATNPITEAPILIKSSSALLGGTS